jgi:hypothetical protein
LVVISRNTAFTYRRNTFNFHRDLISRSTLIECFYPGLAFPVRRADAAVRNGSGIHEYRFKFVARIGKGPTTALAVPRIRRMLPLRLGVAG